MESQLFRFVVVGLMLIYTFVITVLVLRGLKDKF